MSFEAELEESVSYTPLQRMRHSAAHVIAEAVLELFPDAKLAIGLAIEDGFYYDFDLPRALTTSDLPVENTGYPLCLFLVKYLYYLIGKIVDEII